MGPKFKGQFDNGFKEQTPAGLQLSDHHCLTLRDPRPSPHSGVAPQGPVPCGPWWPHSRGCRQHTLLRKAQRYLHQHTEDMGQVWGGGRHCCPHREISKMGWPDRAMNSRCLNLSNSFTFRYQFSSKNNLRSIPHVLILCF